MERNETNAELTTLLHAWRAGDRSAADQVLTAVYAELRRLAAHYLKSERPDHTLNPTSLVHELYLNLLGKQPPNWQDRIHFFAIVARQLRRLLVDHARKSGALRRGGVTVRVQVDEGTGTMPARDESLLAVDDLLVRLTSLDERAGQVVELRFFGGLKEEEVAEAMGISVGTVRRDWAFARAWMLARLDGKVASE